MTTEHDATGKEHPEAQTANSPRTPGSDPEAMTAMETTAVVPAGRVCTIVAEHVEQVTRFDAADLHENEPEQVYGVALELTLDQEVTFEIQNRSGPGGLPSGATMLGGPTAFSTELQSRLSKAQEEASEALLRWANRSPDSYRRLLPPGAAFLTAPGSVGYEHVCFTCNGACKITCATCGGSGQTDCRGCYGSGRVNCSRCQGTKSVSCGSCNGRGSWNEQVSEQTWDSSSNGFVTAYRSVYKSCYSCTGGRSSCSACGYDGKISCSGCAGSGNIRCIPCSATGRMNCPGCLASGIMHDWGTVKAEVAHQESLFDEAREAALNRLIQDVLPREDLPALGELLDVRHTPSFDSIRTQHRLRLDVRRAHIRARAYDVVIYGFGPAPKVFSFENIAGHLLNDDLATLEASVAGAARWRRHRSSELLDKTADFLRSELNMLVAEQVAGLKISPQEAAAEVRGHFHGLVDAGYVERATTALRGALARLYGSELAEPAAYLCGIAAVVASFLFALDWPQPGFWSAFLWSCGYTALVWGVLEWLTRRRIAKRFEPEFAQRVLSQLRVNGSVKRWRIGMAAAVPLAVFLAMVGTGLLPSVRSHRAERQEAAQAALVLEQWAFQGQPDLRLRQYPARLLLDQKAADGESRAQIILAWQLLLGAGGASKDVDAASQWLDKAHALAGQEPLWLAAKAVWTLNQKSMPDAIRSAAQDLGSAADRGLVEARYWEARIYLEERSPAYDPKRGMKALVLAADLNHAHAALSLGERLAATQGTRRDLAGARRYLQRAAGAGLDEAREALSKLR